MKERCNARRYVEERRTKLQREAAAMDSGEMFTAGKRGLVSAKVEQYDAGLCSFPGEVPSYNVVAVLKKDSGCVLLHPLPSSTVTFSKCSTASPVSAHYLYIDGRWWTEPLDNVIDLKTQLTQNWLGYSFRHAPLSHRR
ncbi:serotransferrin-1-like [Salvelinus namaycush]|uniref:Serotransferrin-1-like n=1 Tax=Salvelinus namaycush TaxID=8040 RepID=A0A8U1BRN2_SALNM|nr:serotransferrin-1-like [Salvelinus namaycush]